MSGKRGKAVKKLDKAVRKAVDKGVSHATVESAVDAALVKVAKKAPAKKSARCILSMRAPCAGSNRSVPLHLCTACHYHSNGSANGQAHPSIIYADRPIWHRENRL
jgi:hypothetical protein